MVSFAALRRLILLTTSALLLAACGGSAAPVTSPSLPAGSAAANASGAIAGSATSAGVHTASVAPLAQPVQVRILLNPLGMDTLPLYQAIDDGAFQKAGLNIQLQETKGSSTPFLAQLAQGSLDVMAAPAAPPLFNQASQGFNAKIIASLGVPKAGRLSGAWLVVQKSEAGQIKSFQDLKGKTVEAAIPGTPMDMMATEAVRLGGLTPGKDVTVTYRAKSAADMLTLAKEKAADVIGMQEPLATQAEREGLVVRWHTYGEPDFLPWYQPSLLAASNDFLTKNPDAAVKFLEVYLAASRQVDATNGQWTPDLLAAVAKRTQIDEATIKAEGGVPYYDPNGTVSIESITKGEDLWLAKDLVKQRVDPASLVNSKPAEEAAQELGNS